MITFTLRWKIRLQCLSLIFLLSCFLATAALPQRSDNASRPNVVVLLADDLGWGDLSCKGGSVPTPHVDRLFKQGVELETFLVTPVCSPTRAALLTGRYPARVGIAPMTVNARAGVHMNPHETTLGEAFKAAGYVTGLIGKWHLGYEPSSPNEQGFDLFYGFFGAATSYLTRPADDRHTGWMLNGKLVTDAGYSTDLIRDRAVRFIAENKERPFFLYVPFNAVHNPVEATKEYVARVPESIKDERARTRAGMLIALDDAVGAIVQKIDDEGLGERTIVVFASDNGPTPDGSARPWRGGKHSLYEGGVRSPTVMRWTGRWQAGSRTKALLSVEDLYPTLLNLTGVPIPQGLPLDGRDFSACLTSNAASPRQQYCWIWTNCDAIRTARYKLVRFINRRELYDLQNDPAETQNLTEQLPQVAADLEKRLDEWEASIPCYPSHVPVKSAQSLKPNPQGDVLEVRVSQSGGEGLAIPLGGEKIILSPGDRLEYDVFIAEGAATRGIRLAVNRARRGEREEGGRIDAVDQFGNPERGSVGYRKAQGQWVHRVIGLANYAPRPMNGAWLLFDGREKAEYLLYVDNLIIRRGDGSVVEIYRDGNPKQQPPRQAAGYPQIAVKAVPVGGVQKQWRGKNEM
jgi:arylsulfatase A-like enzyme